MFARTEFERPVRIGDGQGQLYASSGRSDDYLELVLPEGITPTSPGLVGLEDLSTGRTELSIDRHEGPPGLIAVTVLYINDPVRRSLPAFERIATILAELAQAAGALDFGDLLPDRLKSKTRPTEPMRPAPTTAQMEAPAHPSPAAAATTSVPLIGLADLVRQGKLEKARTLAARGQYRKAQRILDEMLSDSPASPEAESLCSTLRQIERREKRAKREPRNPQAHLEVGFSYLALERNGEAARSLEQASRLEPDLYLAHLLLGIALHREGNVIAARSAYSRAGRLRPADQIHRDLLSALERGDPPAGLAEAGRGHSPVTSRPRRQEFAWSG